MPLIKAPEIASSLRARIASGEWGAGAALPTERALAESFGVARNTIRNAFDRLENEGLISRHVGRGTVVRQQASGELLSILDRISGASPLDILNLRIMMEPQGAAAAAANASARQMEMILEANGNAVDCMDLETFERWDNEFHGRICEGSRNEFLVNLHRILSIIRYREAMMEIRRRTFSENNRLAYCEQHERIILALQARDATAAAEAMRFHLLARRRIYFGE